MSLADSAIIIANGPRVVWTRANHKQEALCLYLSSLPQNFWENLLGFTLHESPAPCL